MDSGRQLTNASDRTDSPHGLLSEKVMRVLFLMCALFFAAVLLIISLFLLVSSIPALRQIGLVKFLFGIVWKPDAGQFGLLPMIVGSVYVTTGALLIGIPLGLLCSIYLIFFCPKKLGAPFESLINLMAGIPSVIYGFFGLMVIVPWIGTNLGGRGLSVLAASLILGLMILPTIISVSATSLASVESGVYQGALALGASHEKSVFFTVVPAAKRGILTAVILGMGRALGETMAVKMVCGNQPILPGSILDGVRTLTTNIVLEMGYAVDLHRQALIATALVLFVLVMMIYLLLGVMQKREA